MFWASAVLTPQGIEGIPDELKRLYKTVWEISQKTVLKMAADRGAYIDQSQSLNIHIAEPNYGKLTSMHFYGWQLVSWDRETTNSIDAVRNNALMAVFFSLQGLKTGMYYLRTKPAANPIQFTLNKEKLKESAKTDQETKLSNTAAMVCSLANKEDCLMCGS